MNNLSTVKPQHIYYNTVTISSRNYRQLQLRRTFEANFMPYSRVRPTLLANKAPVIIFTLVPPFPPKALNAKSAWPHASSIKPVIHNVWICYAVWCKDALTQVVHGLGQFCQNYALCCNVLLEMNGIQMPSIFLLYIIVRLGRVNMALFAAFLIYGIEFVRETKQSLCLSV